MKRHFTFSRFIAATAMLFTFVSADASVLHSGAMFRTSLQAESASPLVTLDNNSFLKARGRVGEKVQIGTVVITASDLPEGAFVAASNSIDGIFTTDVTTLPAGNSTTTMNIFYEAKKIGEDKGQLYIMQGENVLAEIKVKGLAIDPANMPAITADKLEILDFDTEVGKGVERTVTINISGFPSSVDVKVKQDKPGFTVNSSILYYSVKTHKLRINFFPKEPGDYEAVITLSNEFVDTVEIKLRGKVTGEEDKPGVEGDQLPLVYDNPVKLFNEHFDNVTHNKPLSIEGWKNVAALGQRAWWGYEFPDYDTKNAGEKTAKVTAYDSQMQPGTEEEFQMLLVAPPLNIKEAASKMFAFRVMGKYMVENMTEKLMLCTLSYDENGALSAYPVEGVVMPSIPDENEKWVDFQVDLTGLQLPDVAHVGFLFMGMRGPDHATTYFIDDVSFGRTDLPVITTSTEEVMMNSEQGGFVMSEEVTVTGTSLVEDIKIELEGKYKEDFAPTAETLPKEGGKFRMAYKSNYKDGYYGVYAVLSSKGAVTKKIAFFATITNGIESVEISDDDVIEVFASDGTKVTSACGISVVEAVDELPAGVYVVRINGSTVTRTIKIKR